MGDFKVTSACQLVMRIFDERENLGEKMENDHDVDGITMLTG